MTDFMIRDLDAEVVAAIDGKAKRLKISRQQFLHEHLQRTFGPVAGNVTAMTAQRLREVFRGLPTQQCSVARVSRALGFADSTQVEAYLSGEEPISFTSANRMCELLGVNAEWLLDGRYSPFYQAPVFRRAWECMGALAAGSLTAKGGVPYSAWYFLLSDEPDGRAALFGYAAESPCRLDLLLRDVPVGDYVGAGGAQQLFDFAILCAAIDGTLVQPPLLQGGFHSWGRVLDRERFNQILGGQIHPGVPTVEERGHVPWAEDLWDFAYEGRAYSESFLAGREVFRTLAREKKVTTNDQLAGYITDGLRERARVAAEAG